ncbi:Cupredoxin [Limtongia smithiae]|uniref:Cupredoxin n=1 Tax=Limtongia smithiae TaxID=1125753 RepID=UPI0034CFED33
MPPNPSTSTRYAMLPTTDLQHAVDSIDSSDANAEKGAVDEETQSFWHRQMYRIVTAFSLLVVFAIALGMGVGLRGSSADATTTTTTTASSTATATAATATATETLVATSLESWRLDTASEYSIDMNWDSAAAPQTRYYNLTVSELEGAPDGFLRNMTVINGKFPGPLIEANEGDTLVITVINNGSTPTTMHWHGLFQNGTNYMDGVSYITQCVIPVGESFVYNFTLNDQYGTYWYHSHYKTQYSDGVVGPLIIHSSEEDDLVKDMYDYDQIVLIGDWYHAVAETYMADYLASGNENVEPVPDNGLINGASRFLCDKTPDDTCYDDEARNAVFHVEVDKTYRFRVINVGSFAEIDWSIDGHNLTLIEGDGTITVPYDYHKVRVGVAQRYSMLVHTNVSTDDGLFWMRAELNQYCFATTNSVLNSSVRGVVVYSTSLYAYTVGTLSKDLAPVTEAWDDVAANVLCLGLNDTIIEPMVVQAAPAASKFYRLDSSFQIKDYAIDLGYINNTNYKPLSSATLYEAYNMLSPDAYANVTDSNSSTLLSTSGVLPTGTFGGNKYQYVVNIPDYAVVDVLINNLDDGAHPFHLHGYKFWVMGWGSGNFKYDTYSDLNATNPMRRDTVVVRAYGWTIIRFIADNPGIWPFHCHITWHLEAGLLMQFEILPSAIAEFDPPEAWAQLCAASSS